MTPDAEPGMPSEAATDAATFAAILSRLRGSLAGNDAAPGSAEPIDAGLIGTESVDPEQVTPELVSTEFPGAVLTDTEIVGGEPTVPKQVDAETGNAMLTDVELPQHHHRGRNRPDAGAMLTDVELTTRESHDVESRDEEPTGNEEITIAHLLHSETSSSAKPLEILPQRASESQQGDTVELPTGIAPALEMTDGTGETPTAVQAEPAKLQHSSQADSPSISLQPERVSSDNEARIARSHSDSLPQHGENPEGRTLEVSAEMAPLTHGTTDVLEGARVHDTNAESHPVSPGTYQPEYVKENGIISSDQLRTSSIADQNQPETGNSVHTNQVAAVRNRPDSELAGTDTNIDATSSQAIGETDGNATDEGKSNVSSHTSELDTPATFNTGDNARDSKQEDNDSSGHAEQGSAYPERAEYPSSIRSPEAAVELASLENIDASTGLSNDVAIDPPVLADTVQEIRNQVETALEPKGQTPAAPSQPLLARPAAAAAWLRSILAHHGQEMGNVGGWQVLNVKLDDEQGHVTVKARREEEKVSISVGFTDPVTRAMVQANAQRIEQTLEAQYQTSVDLSFFTGSEEQGGPGDNHQRGPETGSGKTLSASVEHTPVATHRPKPASALREWVV